MPQYNRTASPSKAPWAESIQPSADVASSGQAPIQQPSKNAQTGATFDSTGTTLSDLKKLQDPVMFNKARFSFRLYKRQ